MKGEHSFCFSLTKFCGNSATKRRPQARAQATLSHENCIIKPRPQAVSTSARLANRRARHPTTAIHAVDPRRCGVHMSWGNVADCHGRDTLKSAVIFVCPA